jgi:hypothetical protein
LFIKPDFFASSSLHLCSGTQLTWMLGSASTVLNGGGSAANAASAARSGARAGRVIRLVRMVRLIRMVKVYKYATIAYGYIIGKKVTIEEDVKGSRVGAAMSDLTNRRYLARKLSF